jgi:hypothetical protein
MDSSLSGFSRPPLGTIALDLAAFAVGLGSARLLGWNTTDLVWSLWLSSLVIGYLTILAMIGSGAFVGWAVASSDGFPAQYRGRALLAGSCLALFMLGFFSVHFCGFHAVHATFLSSFFPLSGVPRQAFGFAFLDPLKLWRTVTSELIPRYGAFLLPAIVAERRAIFGPLAMLVRAGREVHQSQGIVPLLRGAGSSPQGMFGRPYLNVVRMHLLIFFFAISHALKIDSFPVYVVVYCVYFFPWSAFRGNDTGGRPAPMGDTRSAARDPGTGLAE